MVVFNRTPLYPNSTPPLYAVNTLSVDNSVYQNIPNLYVNPPLKSGIIILSHIPSICQSALKSALQIILWLIRQLRVIPSILVLFSAYFCSAIPYKLGKMRQFVKKRHHKWWFLSINTLLLTGIDQI